MTHHHPAAALLAHAMAPLAALVERPGTQEVAVNTPGEVWWRGAGPWERRDEPALDFQMLEGIAVLAGAVRGQDVGRFRPLLATEMPGPGSALLRLQVCMPPAVPPGTISLTWRRPEDTVAPLADMPARYRMDGWNNWEGRGAARRAASAEVLAAFDEGDAPRFLALAMRARLNVWMCAATGGGKTGLFRSIMTAVDPAERIVTVEDSLELILAQPNNVRLLYQHGAVTGGAVRAEDLIVAALRMRPDRIPVQEVRTAEAAWVYLRGAMTGHPGSPTTIHGETPAVALRNFFALCKGTPGGGAMGDDQLARMIGDAVDVLIPMRNEGAAFVIKEVWFRDDAARRGEGALDLLRDGDR